MNPLTNYAFNICKSEYNCLFRTFQKRTRAYFRVWRQGCAILLRRPWYLPNSLYYFTSKIQLFHPLHVESIFPTFKVPTQIHKFQRQNTEWRSTYSKGADVFFWYFLVFFFWNWYFSSTFPLFFYQKELSLNHLGA